jgi:hypothetical protein
MAINCPTRFTNLLRKDTNYRTHQCVAENPPEVIAEHNRPATRLGIGRYRHAQRAHNAAAHTHAMGATKEAEQKCGSKGRPFNYHA